MFMLSACQSVPSRHALRINIHLRTAVKGVRNRVPERSWRRVTDSPCWPVTFLGAFRIIGIATFLRLDEGRGLERITTVKPSGCACPTK